MVCLHPGSLPEKLRLHGLLQNLLKLANACRSIQYTRREPGTMIPPESIIEKGNLQVNNQDLMFSDFGGERLACPVVP